MILKKKWCQKEEVEEGVHSVKKPKPSVNRCYGSKNASFQ